MDHETAYPHRRRRLLPIVVLQLFTYTVGCQDESQSVSPGAGPIELVRQAAFTNTVGAYGSAGDDSFENGWATSFEGYGTTATAGFMSVMGGWNTNLFWNDLRGTKPYLEDTLDQTEGENADILWIFTHGSVIPENSYWSMWDQWIFAYASNIRLGDEGRGTKILASHACKIMWLQDGVAASWNRLKPIFKGGLKVMVGSHDLIHWGPTVDEVGQDFASNLAAGYSITTAWREGLYDWWWDQDIAVGGTGATANDCLSRLGKTYGQLMSNTAVPVLRDAQTKNYCVNYWTDY